MTIKSLILAAGLCLVSTAAFSQKEETSWNPNWYVGVQGGVQAQPLNGNLNELMTPHYGIQIGRQLSDVFGMRIQALGYESKAKTLANAITTTPDVYMKYKVWSAKWDLLFNVTNIIAPNRLRQNFNWNVFLGAGATGAWNTTEYSDKTALYVGAGTQIEYLFTKNFGINLEVQANPKYLTLNDVDRGNSWQGVALLGLTYHFGHKKATAKVEEPAAVVVPVVAPVYETRVDTIWYEDTEYKTEVVTEDLTCHEFYQICKSSNLDAGTVSKVSDFVKGHKNVAVTITGYADKGTGNAKLNMKYSKMRAEGVVEGLKKAGIPAEVITNVDWKGDSVQLFDENDKNRVAVIKATGQAEKKTPVKVKKFRTEEVRYEVK